LKLKYDVLLSNFSFNFNLRRNTEVALMPEDAALAPPASAAGAYTRPIFSST
jgi:hypothetical protein